jgi:thiol:disulfide interchange protein DsbD
MRSISPARAAHPALRAAFAALVVVLTATPTLTAARPLQADMAVDVAERVAPPIELAALPRSAEATAIVESDGPQVRARLLLHRDRDETLRAGVLFDLAPGWHLYWRNPGGTGIAPRITLSAPDHRADALDWPAPRTFVEADGLFTTWGYEGSVLLSATLRPDDAIALPLPAPRVEAQVSGLVCRTECVPIDLSLELPAGHALPGHEAREVAALFRDQLARVPIDGHTLGVTSRAHWREAPPGVDARGELELVVETCAPDASSCPRVWPGAGQALFVPMEQETFELEAARPLDARDSDRMARLAIPATRLEPGDDRLRGLLPLRFAHGEVRHVEIDVPIEPPGTAATIGAPATSPGSKGLAWLHVLGLALLGGLILNGMPCVLPVLAIKVFSIANMAEKHPREVRLDGLAYTAGVLASMLALACVVLLLRAAGHAVGWGFQFQEPVFVGAIAAILVTFALNLFGVFEIELGQGRLAGIGQGATGARRSAFEGLLAVVLATPCTAPFLGTAVGFAFASSGPTIAAIFLAIGMGLASPFLLVSFSPRLARFVPRSGPWMNTLRAGLGFSLLATVVWLLWLLGQSGGAGAVVSTLALLLGLAFLVWVFGQLKPMHSVWLSRAGVLSIAAVAVAGFNLIELDPSEATRPAGGGAPAIRSEAGSWTPWNEQAVEVTLAAGRPVFVVFTADWCITCKMNEHTVLERTSVREALDRHGYARFAADWTRRDERIRRKLAEFGRAGVPLYLVYGPEAPDHPRVLSELLSVDEVLTALAEGAFRPAT